MGRGRLRKSAGVIAFCKQLGHIIVGVHPIVPMDFGVLVFLCITKMVRRQLGNTNTSQRDVFQTQLGGTSVLNS